MRLTTSLRILAFALLAESIIQAVNIILLENIDVVSGTGSFIPQVIIFYQIHAEQWVLLLLYAMFVIKICSLDSMSPDAKFGSYFRRDLLVVLLNTLAINLLGSLDYITYGAKTLLEILAIITSFMAGHSIHQGINTPEMRMVRKAYWIMALRHMTYSLILICSLWRNLIDDVPFETFFNDRTSLVVWCLLMPTLIISRVYLYLGIRQLQQRRKASIKMELREV